MYKERGKMYVVIRTVYCSEKKRGVQEQVCSFKIENIVIINFEDDLIQDQLNKANATESEIAEFKEWFDVTKAEHMKEHNSRKNDTALSFVKYAKSDINEEITEEQAQAIYAEIKELKNKLRELGHKEKRAVTTAQN